MSTTLKVGSALLFNRLTGLYLYPHVISFDPNRLKWRVETCHWTLLPFYFVTVVLMFGVVFFTCLYEVSKFVNGTGSMPGFLAMVTMTVSVLSVYDWGFSIPSIWYANEMVVYMNAILDYERTLRGDGYTDFMVTRGNLIIMASNMLIMESRKKRCKKSEYKSSFKMSVYIHYLLQQIRDLLKGNPNVDIVGVLMNLMVIYMVLGTNLIVPIALYFQLDPFYYMLNDWGVWGENGSPAIKIVAQVFRVMTSYLGAVETGRTFLLFINPLLHHYFIYCKSLEILRSLPYCRKTVRLFVKLRLIHQYGDGMVKYSIAVTLSTGFFLAIMMNCFTVIGWKLFPTSIYICGVPLTPIIYFLILGAQHLWAKCHQLSGEMIRNEWPRQQSADFGIWIRRRIARCHRPIIFCSGSFARMNQETKRHTLDFLVNYTVNALLLLGQG